MASPPHNIGSDAEDGEISASEDETTVGKDDAQECSIASALPVGKSEEESCEDLSPQRKKLKLDVIDDAVATMENISSPSSVTELSAGEDAMVEAMEEGEGPSKDEGEEPSKEDAEEEGEEGEILSDSDEDEQTAVANEATTETTSNKSPETANSKKGSSQDYSSRDGRRSPSPRDRYQDRRRYRYSGHSQSPSSSSRNNTSNGGSSSNHLARKGVKRPSSIDRRTGADIRNRKEGSPFTKRKPKMKAPPPSNSPFWGERKHLLPTPSASPRTGYNLDSDYPQLPRRLVKEYFPDPPVRFVRDSHNFPPGDHNRSDSSAVNKATEKNKDNDTVSQPSPAALSNEEEAEDMATQEYEGAIPSLPSMQELVKNQMYADSNSEMEALPPPLIEDKSLEAADTLADVFSEDFPLMDGETPKQEEATSLKKLVAGGSGSIDITIAAGEQKGNLNNKVARQVHKQLSAKKQLKATAWHAKQKLKQKDNKDHEKSLQPCKYFQNGFCKSGDSCPYSHAGPTKNKKKEVCRYYLGDNCTKGDECPYLHETFPCKFFHSRNFCIHGDSCRFSHAPLNDESRELLATVLQQDAKQPGASTPVMANVNNIAEAAAQPHPMPQPLMSVDTSAMAPLVGGAAPPLMQQDHPPRPPWDSPAPLQPPVMIPPPQFNSGINNSGPRPEPNSTNMMRPPEPKLGILPTPPAYMKLIPDNTQIPGPGMSVNTNINTAVQDPRSSCDPRMNQQQQHLKRQEQFELPSSGESSGNETTSAQSKEQDNQADDDTKQTDGTFPLFQPLEPPRELSRQKPHFIPDLPTSSVGASDNVDPNLPSHIARPSSNPHHGIDQSPSRPRNLKSKYSHLKVKSRASKSSATPLEEQSQVSAAKRDNMHKSILKRTVEKPKEPFSMYLQDGIEEINTGYGEIQPMFSSRTNNKASVKEDSKSSSPEKAVTNNDTDKKATKKDSSVPYYAMFDTGFGSDLQIDSAFGSLED